MISSDIESSSQPSEDQHSIETVRDSPPRSNSIVRDTYEDADSLFNIYDKIIRNPDDYHRSYTSKQPFMKLCALCQSLFHELLGTNPRDTRDRKHWNVVSELSSSAKSGCELCTMFWKSYEGYPMNSLSLKHHVAVDDDFEMKISVYRHLEGNFRGSYSLHLCVNRDVLPEGDSRGSMSCSSVLLYPTAYQGPYLLPLHGCTGEYHPLHFVNTINEIVRCSQYVTSKRQECLAACKSLA